MDKFQMQVRELIGEVKPDIESRLSAANEMLWKIKHIIENISPQQPLLAAEAKQKLMTELGISIPFPEPQRAMDDLSGLSFAKPSQLNVIGSTILKTAVGHEDPIVIDMAVTMPLVLLHPKDYLNYRYFNKRAFYLACIAAGISMKKDLPVDVEWAFQNGNFLQPVILISASQNTQPDTQFQSSNCQVRILIGPPENVFPSKKLLPHESCVHPSTCPPSGNIPSDNTPTSLYNGTIQSESSMGHYFALLNIVIAENLGFRDACVLATIWLRQRGFDTSISGGGFGSFEAASMIALLLRSSYETGTAQRYSVSDGHKIFKIFLHFLCSRNLMEEPFVVGVSSIDRAPTSVSRAPTFYDYTTQHNLLFKMSAWSYRKLRCDAQATAKLFHQSVADSFNICFITKVDNPVLEFDQLVQFVLPKTPKRLFKEAGHFETTVSFCDELVNVLTRSLGNRARMIYPKFEALKRASLASEIASDDQCIIVVGISVDPEHSLRTVDLGPVIGEKKETELFRQFWGEKAELRRFKDGTIRECLIWSSSGNDDLGIVKQIIRYGVRRHLGEEVMQAAQFIEYDLVPVLGKKRPLVFDRISASHHPWDAFEELRRRLMTLKSLPLAIRDVSASRPRLNCSSVKFSRGTVDDVRDQAMDIVIQFESSVRWPDDTAAIQQTKIAFLAKIGELLNAQKESYTCYLGIENEELSLLNVAFLDIVQKTIVFRCRVFHDRESTLLTHQLHSKNSSGQRREAAAHATAVNERSFVLSPLHTQLFRILCSKFTLLSPTICLLRHWFSSHLLESQFSMEILELFVAQVFTSPLPYSPPGCLSNAFFRSLSFIANWDWMLEPLILDLRGDMTVLEVEAIKERFDRWRCIDPNMERLVLFVASNSHLAGTAWTIHGPNKVAATRLTALARAASTLIMNDYPHLDTKRLFVSDLAEYDFVIHLNLALSSKNYIWHNEKQIFEGDSLTRDYDSPNLYNEFRHFTEELEKTCGGRITFFHNSCVLPVIAGLWKPGVASRLWKASSSTKITPLEDQKFRFSANREGIMNNIARLGGDIISRISIRG